MSLLTFLSGNSEKRLFMYENSTNIKQVASLVSKTTEKCKISFSTPAYYKIKVNGWGWGAWGAERPMV